MTRGFLSPLTALAVVAMIALAGCTTGSDDGTASGGNGVDPPAQGETVGAVDGQVLNSEGLPIGGADVAVLGLGIETRTDETGAFLLEHVPAGKQTVLVQRLGYDVFTGFVEVVAGQTSSLQVVLEAIEVSDPRHETSELSGRLACSYYTPIPTAVEHPTEEGYLFHPWTTCSEPVRQQFGEHVHCLDFPVGPKNTWRMAELVWTQTNDLSPENLWLGEDHQDPEEAWWDNAEGPSPVVVKTEEQYSFDGQPDEPPTSTWCVFISSLSWPAPSVALEQTFTIYYTAFYDMDAIPDGFSAQPDA
jgi:hypothetical protein